jgi:trans-aconitate 2-methyltransferase
MSRDIWDPDAYGRYADERARPFFELLARVRATDPAYVVDLGCGTGELTATLAARWPNATVHGLDASRAMIARAQETARAAGIGTLVFEELDLRAWRPSRPVDVLVSNAVLHWVPEHRRLLPTWVDALAPGGWLAFQVPGNFDAPSHVLVRELCRTTWRDELGDVAAAVLAEAPVGDPEEYLGILAEAGCAVDAWETTYIHVLPGENAVLNWLTGTTLRPLLDRLAPERRGDFLADCARVLGRAYPREPYGTPFPFRRIFVVAHKR